MKGFTRKNPMFSLCGLNCFLCSMHLGGHCGGCGFGNQSCPLARCSLEHGAVEYCFQCAEYPCERYSHIDAYDSFITHQKQKSDLEKARRIGLEAYNAEQRKKSEILERLLSRYNDGRKKTLFCLAVNLLELDELTAILEQADAETNGLPVKEKAAFVSALFQKYAAQKGLTLKLRRK
ncbi:MAG: DUF3795 domain-containing protein [Provencibacterium sp.]|jgi:hypothetical protein|nr:DUF3795 domain-containing protein [Provencibacterium sp.]